jgi:hypothetical protein
MRGYLSVPVNLALKRPEIGSGMGKGSMDVFQTQPVFSRGLADERILLFTAGVRYRGQPLFERDLLGNH